MKRINFYALSLILLFSTALHAMEAYQVKKLTILEVNSSINPATYNYLKTNLTKLSQKQGDLLFIKLDTPGGLVSTTKDIITLIGSVDFPVGIWVTPEGASATSAGAIIASSSHILVMSEGTNIGAATPINMGKDIDQKDAKSKAVNDLVALVRSLSKARGRNPDPFEKMISEAKSLDARTALKENVIDKIINSQHQLLSFLNSKEITIKGNQYRIQISPQMTTKTIEMDAGQKILNIFANPTTAYILFIIGAALIYFEMQAPGGFIAGGVGVLFLFLAGIGFQVLPLNIGAMGLIILSFFLFVLEAYITSFGVLTLAGIASLIFGSLFLFRTENSLIEVEISVILSVVSAIIIYVALIGWFFIKTYIKRKNYYVAEHDFGYISKVLEPKDEWFNYQIKISGEIWSAKSKSELSLEDKVEVEKTNEDHLIFIIKKV